MFPLPLPLPRGQSKRPASSTINDPFNKTKDKALESGPKSIATTPAYPQRRAPPPPTVQAGDVDDTLFTGGGGKPCHDHSAAYNEMRNIKDNKDKPHKNALQTAIRLPTVGAEAGFEVFRLRHGCKKLPEEHVAEWLAKSTYLSCLSARLCPCKIC